MPPHPERWCYALAMTGPRFLLHLYPSMEQESEYMSSVPQEVLLDREDSHGNGVQGAEGEKNGGE